MKALVIRQPWAELIACGLKTIEVRPRQTKVLEEFLIVAGKTIDKAGMALHGPRPLPTLAGFADHFSVSTGDLERMINPPMIAASWPAAPMDTAAGALNGLLPIGVAVAIARVYKVEAFHSPEHERAALLPWDGRAQLWAWHLGNVRRIKPFAVRGMPGWFNVDMVKEEHEKHEA